jgi:putative aldouronate transport system substrate-binding protein
MKRLILILLPLVLIGGVLFAGGSSQSGPSASATATPVGSYPVSTNVTLTYWVQFNGNVSANYTNLGETPYAKALQEKTGIKVTFLHPPSGGAGEQLNLMIADGTNMPDIIEWNWITFPGGPEKAIADGTILKLNDTLQRYAPNLTSLFSSNAEYNKYSKTDDGSYYAFPFIRGAEKLLYSYGLMIRKDWLDELGLTPPDTMDELYTVLKAFKERKNCPSPFSIDWGMHERMFTTTFGFLKNWHIGAADGRACLGIIQPEYRLWMQTLAQWYREGLLDPDIVTVTGSQLDRKVTSGTVGATMGWVGANMGTWTQSARATNPGFTLIPLADPVLRRGDRRVYAYTSPPYSGQDSAAITASSKNAEIAARLLDFGYTREGHNLMNFGVEGESFSMVNGRATYTPQIFNNPKGWSLGQSIGAYARSVYGGPFIQDERYVEQYFALPEQALALVNFVIPGALNYIMPPITPTQAESREVASIMSDISTYANEMMVRFILGTEPLNDASWNNYLNTINRMNVDRAIAIQNAALDRYKRR